MLFYPKFVNRTVKFLKQRWKQSFQKLFYPKFWKQSFQTLFYPKFWNGRLGQPVELTNTCHCCINPWSLQAYTCHCWLPGLIVYNLGSFHVSCSSFFRSGTWIYERSGEETRSGALLWKWCRHASPKLFTSPIKLTRYELTAVGKIPLNFCRLDQGISP